MRTFILFLFLMILVGCTELDTQMRAARESTSQMVCWNMVHDGFQMKPAERYCLQYMGTVK